MKRVSFIHCGNPEMGSYRLRAQIPARENGWSFNDFSADVLILSKPMKEELSLLDSGQFIVADFCDPHFITYPHYREFLKRANAVTCSSNLMGQLIASQGREAMVIPDCIDNEISEPHSNGVKLAWFGHQTNFQSINRIRPSLSDYELRVLCNTSLANWCESLNHKSRDEVLKWADIAIFPQTDAYKNPNRAVTALMAGCFVVAEPHPAYVGLPVYVGDIKEGIEWARKNPSQVTELIKQGQVYVSERYAPRTVASAWKKAIQSVCTLDAASTDGKDGLTATFPTPMLTPTLETFPSMTTMQTPQWQSMLSNISTNGKPQTC